MKILSSQIRELISNMLTMKNLITIIFSCLVMLVQAQTYKYKQQTIISGKIVKTTDVTKSWNQHFKTIDSLKLQLDVCKSITQTPPVIPPSNTANYYVSTNGNDANAGTIDSPFLTIQKAISIVAPEQIIQIRGGVYKTGNLIITKSGVAGKLIILENYPGESVKLDLSGASPDHGIYISGSFWKIKGLEITGYKQPLNGDYIATVFIENGTNNIFENLNIHHNQGCGIYLEKSANNNIILNCDFHHNYDALTPGYQGGNADGAHHCTYANTVNSFIGCRFYNNSDDGLDEFCGAGKLYVTNCWAFWNGYLEGTSQPSQDGCGFKIGGLNDAGGMGYTRIFKNCLSVQNKTRGFNDNHSVSSKDSISYSIAYDNRAEGFNLNNSNFVHVLLNNISLKNVYSNADLNSQTVQKNNSWNGYSPSDADFESIDATQLLRERKSDGSLPDITFLKVKTSSPLINIIKN